jgi:hypothetical protein
VLLSNEEAFVSRPKYPHDQVVQPSGWRRSVGASMSNLMMLLDNNEPGLQELLSKLVTLHLVFVISSVASIAIGSAALIQTLNTLIQAKIKATNEWLSKQLETETRRRQEAEQEMVRLREELKRYEKLEELVAQPPTPLQPSLQKIPSPSRYIKIAGLVAAILTLAAVPMSSLLRQQIENYASRSHDDQQANRVLTDKLNTLSSPFTSSDLIELVQAPKQKTRTQGTLDGHSYDLDKLTNRAFTYQGAKPALLIASDTNRLTISSPGKKRFTILIKPELPNTIASTK